MYIKNYRDFWSGILFIAFGLAFISLSREYTMGSAAKMGPAYFPTLLGGLLSLLGAAITFSGLGKAEKPIQVGEIGWREILAVLLAVTAFAASLPSLGIIVSIVLLIWIAAPASHEFNWKDTVVTTFVLLFLSYLVFVKGLELQFPFLPKFLDR